jgi:hypothetical protein
MDILRYEEVDAIKYHGRFRQAIQIDALGKPHNGTKTPQMHWEKTAPIRQLSVALEVKSGKD